MQEPKGRQMHDYRPYPVLYVDDEPENLRIFELAFRRDFEILTAPSAAEALEVIQHQRVAIVLSDHRMPGMTGTEFLARVREIDPKTIRILVTAYGDVETLSAAINDGSVYKYVAKPWQQDELRHSIQRAISVYAMERERESLVRQLTLVNDLAQMVNQELSLEPLFETLLGSLTELMGFDGATLMLLDPAGETLCIERVHPSWGLSDEVRNHRIPADAAPRLFDDVLEGRTVRLRFDDVTQLDAPVRVWLTELAADEVLLVPMRGKRGIVGALAVDNRSGGRRFDQADERLLDSVANVAVVAIENARLVEDLRNSRRQVMRADRLGTLGTLAAGLAHEINNPLVSIHTFLSLVPEKRRQDDDDFWGEYYRLACSEVERIRGLVATMSRLGRSTGEAPKRELVDLGALAAEVSTLLGREARAASVDLQVAAETEAPKVVAVRDQLHQVLLNLVLNAVHASPPEGVVEITVRPGGPGGELGATVEVVDHGGGIIEEQLERIFDPFYTTKGPDGGTGLGLMICHRLVADHGGLIEVASRVGEGSTFRVVLPAQPPQPEPLG